MYILSAGLFRLNTGKQQLQLLLHQWKKMPLVTLAPITLVLLKLT